MTIVMSPIVAELFPAIVGLILAGMGWGAALYTKRVHDRAKADR